MNQLILLIVGVITLGVGSVLGYYVRQSIAKRRVGTIEEKLQKRISQTKAEAEEIISEAKNRASKITEQVKRELEEDRQEILKTEKISPESRKT